MSKYRCALLFATSTLAFTTVANAQDAAPEAAAPAASDSGLGEIVVTAQRRAENLTSVPLSISAQTGAGLAASGIKALSDIKFSTPGFIAQSGTGYTQIYIRGIGNGVYVGADPSVATFIDDVPHVYGSLVEDLVNVDRVEILKGAQGGLYGRNASGGVVNIITKQPSDKFSAFGRFTGASRDTFSGSAYVNMPLNDRIAWNFSLTRDYHGPYRKNVAYKNPYQPGDMILGHDANSLSNPTKLNNQNVWSFDTKLRVKLTDNLKVTLGVDYTDDHDASGNGWLSTTPATSYGAYLAELATYVNFPGHTTPTVTPVAPWPTLKLNSNDSYQPYPNKSWTEDYGGSAKVELNTDLATFTSITAFRWNNSQYQGDIGAAPVPIAGFSTNFRRRYFYQELRAVSNGSGPFHWLGGVTYFKDKIDASIASILLGAFFDPTTSVTHTKNYTGYVQGAYDITDKLTFQASVRYAHETKSVAFPAPNPVTDTTKVHKFIPAATLSYKVDGGVIYARYAKGFKTGGPNPLVRPDRIPNSTLGLILKPETVDTFEIGYRATLFDRKVQFTSAIFYNSYKDIHVTTSGTGPSAQFPNGNADISNALVNLGNARSYGAEASVVWRVAKPITLSANIGYLDGKYKKANFAGNALLLPLNASGNRMLLAPKWQGGFQINIDQPINDSTSLKANLLYSYISHAYFTTQEQKTADQPGYSLVNLRAGATVMHEKLGLYLFVNNLFDKRYYVFGSSAGVGDFETPGDPRIIGGTVEVKF